MQITLNLPEDIARHLETGESRTSASAVLRNWRMKP
jgi:hypothetical protein